MIEDRKHLKKSTRRRKSRTKSDRRRPLFLLLLSVILLVCPALARAADRPVSFNLSTSQTFSPGERPKIHLYTHNVDALEFRVYRVDDPTRFLENLRDLHSFGNDSPWGPKEQVDEQTWLERFHDWKRHLWYLVRSFFRRQFSTETRDTLRDHEASAARRSRIVGVAQFAQVPLLNDRQLVSRWRQEVPSTFVSDGVNLPVDPLPSGLYLVEATDGHYKAYTLLMVSQMALVTRIAAGSALAFAVDRQTGAPIPGAKVEMGFGQQRLASSTTGPDGVARIDAKGSKETHDNFWVIAQNGADFAAVTPEAEALNSSSTGRWSAYLITDRPVYRPGHTVHWKAILREHVDNQLALPKPGKVAVSIVDGQDATVFDGTSDITAGGTVAGSFDLPRSASLGYYTLRVGEGDDVVTTDFHVEDYRKPEYQVRVTAAQPRILQGQTMHVTIDSRYFFGEPVANGQVKYRVYHEPHYWWGEEPDADTSAPDISDTSDADSSVGYGADQETEKTGKLDAQGKLVIDIPTSVSGEHRSHTDLDYVVEAGVTDPANREITGRGRFLATYANFRMDLEPISYAARVGDDARFRITAVDYNNNPVQTSVRLRALYRKWTDGKEEITRGSETTATTDLSGHAQASLRVEHPGSVEIEATAAASSGRAPTAETSLYVLGSNEEDWGGSDISQTVQLVADKKTYAPGDIAHLSILSEVAGFHALVVAQGYVVSKREVLASTGKTLTFDLPITSNSEPNVTIDVAFIKDNQLFQASRVLKVPPAEKQLSVTVTPAKDVFQPQQQAVYDVLTKDSSGHPVSADLSFGVVDEAIYSLYPDPSGDMVHRLYPTRSVNADVQSSLTFYFSGEAGTKSPMLAARPARSHPQLAQVKAGNEAKPRVRKAFPDTAFWTPDVHTDSSGHARVNLTFPDSLTTWRTTVHAITADSKAGSTINRVLVRKNLLVRMGTPRFLRKGDEVTVPVIVHNYLDSAKDVELSLRATGVDLISGGSTTVHVASRGEATALWRFRASTIGAATFTAQALNPEESDALEISLPVEADGVPEHLSQSGVVPGEGGTGTANLRFPPGTDPSAHTLTIDVSPSIAGSLFGALNYLTSFPYGCTEQTMSAFLPDIIVAETVKKLHGKVRIDQADLDQKIAAGLGRLVDYQHEDGGWGWWKEDDSRVFMTAYVVGGLGEASSVTPLTGANQGMLTRGRDYLLNSVKAHPNMRPDLRAAVLYALAQSSSSDTQTDLRPILDAEWSRRDDLSPEALAMTGLSMLDLHDPRAAEASTLLESHATHQGSLVSWKGNYVPLLDLDTDNSAEATAYSMRLLSRTDPSSPLLPAAAQWLMLNRRSGLWWDTTEQTAMVVFGLADYLTVSHELDASFTAEVLVNGRSVGERSFTPADALSANPTSSLSVELDAGHLSPGANTVEVRTHGGTGRAYWSVRGTYFSTDKHSSQRGSLSLNLTRDYFRLRAVPKAGGTGGVVYALDPFNGQAQIGDVLAVHLRLGGSPIRYLLLEDPIPAGAEFVRSEDSYPLENRPDTWSSWYTRREFHDDHAAFFSTAFNGHEEIFYLVKIVNPGTFHVSPASVEPMYQPGIQATSDAVDVIVSGGSQP